MNSDTKYFNMMEVLINIFTIDKGTLKILLFKKNTDPYKGYWMLPSSLLFADETVYSCALDTIKNMVGLEDMHLENCSLYSDLDRVPDKRVIGYSMIGLVDSATANFKREEIAGFESEWFDCNQIPKTVTDHNQIIEDAKSKVFDELLKGNILNVLFPSDFTLPELQRIYEQILNKELDRRNFRKKILNLGIIEPTGEKNDRSNGRPANLYRFKEQYEIKNLF